MEKIEFSVVERNGQIVVGTKDNIELIDIRSIVAIRKYLERIEAQKKRKASSRLLKEILKKGDDDDK